MVYIGLMALKPKIQKDNVKMLMTYIMPHGYPIIKNQVLIADNMSYAVITIEM